MNCGLAWTLVLFDCFHWDWQASLLLWLQMHAAS